MQGGQQLEVAALEFAYIKIRQWSGDEVVDTLDEINWLHDQIRWTSADEDSAALTGDHQAAEALEEQIEGWEEARRLKFKYLRSVQNLIKAFACTATSFKLPTD